MEVIYVDAIFFINAIIDYLTLLITAKIGSVIVPRWRIALGALFGGLYSVMVLFPQAAFLREGDIKIVVGILMVLIVFGGQTRLIRETVIFFVISAAFAGLVLAAVYLKNGEIDDGLYIAVDFKILIGTFAVSYAALSVVFNHFIKNEERRISKTILSVETEFEGKKSHFNVLVDTGNALVDPMTGRSVLIIGRKTAKKVFPPHISALLSEENIQNPIELMGVVGDNARIWLVPYNTVGNSSGILPAFRPEWTVVDGKEKQGLLIGVSPNEISDGIDYCGIIGAD